MEAISIMATHRGTTEEQIVNTYTYRQFQHIATAYLKDKFMIIRSIFSSMGTDEKKSARPEGLPKWYKSDQPAQAPKSGSNPKLKSDLRKMACVINLDGPLERLSGYVGGVGKHIRRRKKTTKKRE